MKKTMFMVLCVLMVIIPAFAGGKQASTGSTIAKATDNKDLIGAGLGLDYGFGPVGFDLDGLVKRLGVEAVIDLKIGISVSTQSNNWQIMWANEFRNLSKKYGFNVVVLSADNDVVKQAEDLRALQSQQVDGIIIYVSNANALAQPIAEIYNAGIPIISALPVGEGGKASGAINVLQEDKGAMIADHVAEDAKGQPRTVMLMDNSGDMPILRDRINGFTQQVKANYPNITIVDERRERTEDGWLNVAKEGLLANDRIDTIVATYTLPMMGGYNAGKQLNRKLNIYGVDADEVTLRLLKNGEINGLHVQWPQVQAYTCLFTLFRAIGGETLPEITWEPANYAMSYATKNEADKILQLLYPDK
jgi:ribose transport system substrate-binding protein